MKLSIALAETILTRYPNPDDFPYKPWCYPQGYLLIGFEKLWAATHDPRYFQYLQRFGDQHVDAEGNILGYTGESLDDIMAGSVLVALYEHTREEKYRVASDRIKTTLLADYPRNSDGGFWHGKALPHEMWIDGVFMGLMFLTRYGAVIGDAQRCFDEAAHQILTLASHCRKGTSGLFLHGYDEAKQVFWADPLTGLSPEVWSEGLGWYALILVETLRLMPVDHKDREAVLQILRDLVEGLSKVQDPQTGLWFQVVDCGERTDNWVDTSGSAMFVYLIQSAVDLGYVNREAYQPVVRRGYEGMRTKAVANAEGLIDVVDACDGLCVQSSYRAYVDYPRVVNAKEAVCGVLWAAEVVEWSKE